MDEKNALVEIVQKSGLEQTKATYILEKFQDYFRIASEWEVKARALVVTNETQVAEMKMAREGRLFLKQKRVDVEKARKELKEQSLREGKAIDGIANVLKALIEPIETYLEEQERFVEVREEKRREARKLDRIALLAPYGVDPTLYDLLNMPDGDFAALLEGFRIAREREQEAARKAEEERLRQEAERERMKKENERLMAEAAEREKKMREERERAAEKERKLKAEAEAQEKKLRAEAAEREKKMREENEAKLRAERLEREKAEAEIRAKKEAEEKERTRLAAEEKKAARAPDTVKLKKLADDLEGFVLPCVKTVEAVAAVDRIRDGLKKMAGFLRDEANK